MSSRRRLLIVTPFPPRRDAAHGGGRIAAEAAAALADRFDVVLLALRRVDEAPVDAGLARVCERVEEIPRADLGGHPRQWWVERRRLALTLRRWPGWAVGASVAALRERLDQLVREERPDVVQFEFLALADALSAIPASGPSVVLVEHDARPVAGARADVRWRSVRRRAAQRADAIVTFSERDAEIVRQDAAATRVEVIPPGIDRLPDAGAGTGPDVLFVGGYGHPPNAESIERLVHVIHPRIRARLPSATLTLVGEGVPDALAGKGVDVPGRVPDLTRFTERASVVVAPVAVGGGMRIKVFDALARGKALVATSRAVEGIGLVDGEHGLIRDGDEAFADAVTALLENRAERERLGAAARAWAEEMLSWDRALDRYDELYRALARR